MMNNPHKSVDQFYKDIEAESYEDDDVIVEYYEEIDEDVDSYPDFDQELNFDD